MRIKASRQFRHKVISLVAGKQSPVKSTLLRWGILLTLLVLWVPAGVSREIVFGPEGSERDLKSALRMMLWLWNRSWVPIHHSLRTYFDIGWVLSEPSCKKLCARGFLKRDPLKRRCDLAQYELASLKSGVMAGDGAAIDQADREICALVGSVLTEARKWSLSSSEIAIPGYQKSVSTERGLSQVPGQFDNEATRSALLEFDDLCAGLGQEYFLVSGTFLGVVRDNSFIGHDNDIDVGVFEDTLLPDLLSALHASDGFVVIKVDRICRRHAQGGQVSYRMMEAPAIIKIVHRSGVAIDIFNHFYDGDLVWHGTSYHRWDNRRFMLKDYEFLGRSFKAAADFDLYLTENYGEDWRVPRPDFDSETDTPNLSFVGSANGLVFFAWTISRFVAENQPERVQQYIEMLCRLGACRIENDEVRVN